MFVLPLGDSAVCSCGIVLTYVLILFTRRGVTFYVFDTMVSFSMFLLVFASIQRLMAVRRPHSFNVKAQRAMIVLIIIAAISVAHTTVATVAQLLMYKQFINVFRMCVRLASDHLLQFGCGHATEKGKNIQQPYVSLTS